jgi:hypothetical protein
VTLAFGAILERHGAGWRPNLVRAVNAALVVAAAAGALIVFRAYRDDARAYAYVARVQAAVFLDRDELRRSVTGSRPLVYALDDGLFAFATGLPTVSGTGLCLDTGGHALSKGGRLADYVRSLGVTHVFVPRYYLPFLGPVRKGPGVDYRSLPEIAPDELALMTRELSWIGRLATVREQKAYVLLAVSP